MNSVRLAKKNDLAVKIMSAFAIAKIVILILNNQSQKGFAILLVLYILYTIGNNVFQRINDRSELGKYFSITSYAVLTFVGVLVSGSMIDALPAFIAMGMCVLFFDEFHILITCGLSVLGTLIGMIIQIKNCGFAGSTVWIETFLFALLFGFAIRQACAVTLRDQDTDKQEIQYHVAYQEEITTNMVKVVDNGNAHIEQLQSKLDSFEEATTEVAKSVDAISMGVTDIADNMETSTTMTQQIQGVIDELIDVKDHTIASTEKAIDSISHGLEVIESLKNKSEDINVANENVTRVSEELCEKIISAEEITKLIYQISSQTNLLALNASIEAARAGEQGRGFAVVADEIRKLAEDTKSSIDSITQLLRGVTVLANETSDLIRKSVEAVEEQATFISAADHSFQSISQVVEELHDDMRQLDKLSGDLDNSNNSIINGLANQQATSEEIASNAQSSAELCDSNRNELRGVIDELNEIAKIIGSLKNADLEEINDMLEQTTVQEEIDEDAEDETDYSSYFDDGEALDEASEEEAEEFAEASEEEASYGEEEITYDENAYAESSYEETAYEESTDSYEAASYEGFEESEEEDERY